MSGTTLLTGFPGFIGRRVVAGLTERDPDARVVALVEPRMLDAARGAAAATDGERVEVVPGDITERRLGLEPDDYDRLRAECASVFHLAAIYDLAVPLAIAQRVNVEGTGNVLDFCRECDGLERLSYVSTAYVAGLRTGVVYEHELALGQGFKNHYESTKFQAEVWVREAMDEVPTTIYRPAIVVGDSRTGETQKFDGPYYLLRAIGVMDRLPGPIARFGHAEAPFNVVPVDFVVEAMLAVSADPEAVGDTLHLVDPEPLTTAELMDALSQELVGRATSMRVSPRLADGMLRSNAIRKAFGGTPRESLRYLNHPVRFDTRRATELLDRASLRVPRFPEYAGAMVGFFREHAEDPAFDPRVTATSGAPGRYWALGRY